VSDASDASGASGASGVDASGADAGVGADVVTWSSDEVGGAATGAEGLLSDSLGVSRTVICP
jgi:hypothetical protein